MKITTNHHTYGTIVYNESFWTGKREISFGDCHLTKQDKRVYTYENDGQKTDVTVKGSFLSGVSLLIGEEKIKLSPGPKWYEILCSLTISVLFLVWGNSYYLCSIIPVIGGAVGGAIGGCMAVVNYAIMKGIKDAKMKLLAWGCIFGATFFLGVGLAYLFAGIL